MSSKTSKNSTPKSFETETLSALLKDLTGAVNGIKKHLKANDLPEPSLAANSLPLDLAIQQHRLTLRRAASALALLADNDPLEHIQRTVYSCSGQYPAMLAAIKLGVFEKLNEGEEVPIDELAKRVECEDILKFMAVLRVLVQNYILVEPREGVFRHNKYSLVLRDEGPRCLALVGETLFCQSTFIYESIKKYPNSALPYHSAWAISRGEGFEGEKSYWDYLGTRPDETLRFQKGLEGAGKHSIKVMLLNYPWAKLKGTLVDVGGSNGYISTQIATVAPHLKYVVQDRANVIEQALANNIVPEQYKDRFEFVVQDFYEEQKTPGDTYFLRMILHNHADDRAVNIIKNLVPQLKPGKNGSGGRILIADSVITPDAPAPLGSDPQITNLLMVGLHNSNERTFSQTEALFKRADPRFRLKQYGANGPMASEIIEAWLVEEDDIASERPSAKGHGGSKSCTIF